MRVIVRKWGDSASIRIPASVMAAANIHIDQPVDVRAESGRIVIGPVAPPDIDALIEAITDENRHDETDMGRPVSREVW